MGEVEEMMTVIKVSQKFSEIVKNVFENRKKEVTLYGMCVSLAQCQDPKEYVNIARRIQSTLHTMIHCYDEVIASVSPLLKDSESQMTVSTAIEDPCWMLNLLSIRMEQADISKLYETISRTVDKAIEMIDNVIDQSGGTETLTFKILVPTIRGLLNRPLGAYISDYANAIGRIKESIAVYEAGGSV